MLFLNFSRYLVELCPYQFLTASNSFILFTFFLHRISTPVLQFLMCDYHISVIESALACLSYMLQVLVNSLEKKIYETEKKYEETSKISEERLKQSLDAEAKIIELKLNMQRLRRFTYMA